MYVYVHKTFVNYTDIKYNPITTTIIINITIITAINTTTIITTTTITTTTTLGFLTGREGEKPL